ncbi:unnamed protein product [Ilex paraguariensis]|uniref:RNase H type-1 domain-containing protein n=1 Tax=Ilex paraguariensis TaxID=185542 RepID=A0ABC8SEK5_9AQUA
MIKPKKEEGRAGTDMLQDLRIYPPFSVTTKVKCMNWEPPAINKVKLNFDGTSKQNGLSSGGMILRDSKGHVLLAAAAAYGIGSNMKAECLALLDALKMIMHHGLGTSQLVLESDSQVLVNVALGVVEVPWLQAGRYSDFSDNGTLPSTGRLLLQQYQGMIASARLNKGVEALVMCCCIYGVGAGFPTDLGSFFILLIFLSAVGLVLCSCDCSRVWRFSAAIAFCPAGPLLFGSCSAGLLGSDGGLSGPLAFIDGCCWISPAFLLDGSLSAAFMAYCPIHLELFFSFFCAFSWIAPQFAAVFLVLCGLFKGSSAGFPRVPFTFASQLVLSCCWFDGSHCSQLEPLFSAGLYGTPPVLPGSFQLLYGLAALMPVSLSMLGAVWLCSAGLQLDSQLDLMFFSWSSAAHFAILF